MIKLSTATLAIFTAFNAISALSANAQDGKALNLYSARHYSTDEALYADFTKQTGIKINRVDADDAGILNRLKAEGTSSPADVILLVDAARLWIGEVDGLFAPVKSKLLDDAIPSQYRAKATPEGTAWFGFSTRARVVVYNKASVKRDYVDTYEELGDAKNTGKLCTRSGSHPYNLSLFGAVMEHIGAVAAERWLSGMVSNMARSPKGGDIDQIRAAASGECAIAVTNSYYLARLMRSNKAEDLAAMDKLGIVFPNQSSWGTHLNIAGGAMAKNAKNREAAMKFLEYLASASAQKYFADGNNEWPIARVNGQSMKIDNPALKAMLLGNGGENFKAETVSSSVIGMNQVKVQQMLDRVGYK